MKKLIITLALFLFSVAAFSQTRNTLWIDGYGGTSLGWGFVPRDLTRDYSYDLEEVLKGQIYRKPVAVKDRTKKFIEGIIKDSIDNILAFGHDLGGLIVRDLAKSNTAITAMVLNATPNHGSTLLDWAINDHDTGKSEAIKVIDKLIGLKINGCVDCSVISSFNNWIGDMSGEAKFLYEEMYPNSTSIAELNSSATNIPFAIFWGSIKENHYTTLLSNYAFEHTGDADHISECYQEVMQKSKSDIGFEYYLTIMDRISGFFIDVIDAAYSLTEIIDVETDPGLFYDGILKFIKESKGEIITGLNNRKEREDKLDGLIRCQLANELMNIEWQLALAKTNSGEFDKVNVSNVPSYEQCDEACRDDCNISNGNYIPWYCYSDCTESCLEGNYTTEVQVIIFEENDGVLLKSEQLLGGSVHDYHLAETNHFQETKLNHGGLDDHIQDLFDGNKGPAFKVNKL